MCLCDLLRCDHRRHRETVCNPFTQSDNVRNDALAFERPKGVTCPAETGLNLKVSGLSIWIRNSSLKTIVRNETSLA